MSTYTIEGLVNGIKRCRHNIVVLEKAIEDERETIKNYRIYMDEIERVERRKAEAEKNVHIEVVSDSANGRNG